MEYVPTHPQIQQLVLVSWRSRKLPQSKITDFFYSCGLIAALLNTGIILIKKNYGYGVHSLYGHLHTWNGFLGTDGVPITKVSLYSKSGQSEHSFNLNAIYGTDFTPADKALHITSVV